MAGWTEGFSKDPLIERVSAGFQMKSVQPFLAKDAMDNRIVVDFMGPAMRSLASDSGPDEQEVAIKVVSLALQFARSELDRLSSEGDEKLIARYNSLLGYMAPRSRLWGLEDS